MFFFQSAAKYGISEKQMERNNLLLRSKTLPAPPKNSKEIIEKFNDAEVLKQYGTTNRDEVGNRSLFYKHAYHCDDFQYCIFASDDIINDIENNIAPESRIYMIDGTFKITPFGDFVQVVIVSVMFLGQV